MTEMPVLDESVQQRTHVLSPFQRAALCFPRRTIICSVAVRGQSGQELLAAVCRALAGHRELTAALRTVQGLRLPRQVPVESKISDLPEGGWRLNAGSLDVSARPSDGGIRLTVEIDALFGDACSVQYLLARIAGTTTADPGTDFLTVAADHTAMAQEGELDQEKRYWQQLRGRPAGDARAALGAARGPSGSRSSARLRLAGETTARLEALAGSRLVALPDLLYLGLTLLLHRVAPDGAALGRLTDTRAILGMEGISGAFTQVLIDFADIDTGGTPLSVLAAQNERLAEHAVMAGGAALLDDSTPPTVLFDPCTAWSLPAGWRLIDTFVGLSGILTLRGQRDEAGLELIADACEGEDPDVLRSVLSTWAVILDGLARQPTMACRDLPLRSAAELSALARDLTRCQDRAPAADLCDRIRAFAEEDPYAGAVRDAEAVITREILLGEIGVLTERLARLEPGDVVAVLAEAGADLLCAWLAVWWRGGTLLPLSPAEPRARIEQALRSSDARAVFVQNGAPGFSAPDHCRVIPLDLAGAPASDPGAPVLGVHGQLGYLLRTSGSTGEPKLVGVTRRSLNNYLAWVTQDLLLDNEELPTLSNPLFDASFKQLLGPLYAGRATWLLRAERSDVGGVYAELAAAGTPFSLNCVPGYWSELIDAGGPGAAPLPLRRLLLGGEPVSEALLQRTAERYPNAEIWNLYGPTETTATATAGRLVPGEPVHVGTAVAGAAVVIADASGQCLPVGARGHVWIAGPGLAQGYLGAAEAGGFGALRFGETAVPAYDSGDIGYLDGAGRLHLAGRLDGQVKINGWRIELEEIERAAARIPGVADALAVLDDRRGTPQLRLFVVAEAETGSIAEGLRGVLPGPMLPASVMSVARFPLTVTGKRDRRALLALVQPRVEASPSDYDPAQLVVATAWREVLGGGWPHPDEEFFDAGGHSLLLARLVNGLRARGHTSLSLRKVMHHPTVALIAGLIQASEKP